MRMNTIKPAEGSKKDRKRRGRGIGSTLGKTAGRGHKGQFARAGQGKVKAGFEGGQMPLQRRLPKVGFRSKMSFDSGEVMMYSLARIEGDVVDIATLRALNLIGPNVKRVKIVKKGEVTRALTCRGVTCTAGAKAAIEAAGGTVE